MPNAVYDDEKQDIQHPVADGSHDDLGVSPEQRAQEVDDLNNLYNAESAPEKSSGTKADNKETGKLDDQVGSGFRNEGESKRIKGGGKSKKLMAGIAVTLSVGAGSLGILQGPNFVINQLREILLTKISSLQTSQTRRYRRAKLNKLSDVFSKDGRRGGKIITEMESRGYKFKFDPNDKNKIVGIELPGGKSGIPNMSNGALAEHIEDYLEIRHPLRTSKWKTKRMEAFYGRYKVSRKAVVVPVDGDDVDPDKTVNKKMAEELIDDGPDEQVTRASSDDPDETDEDKATRESREADIDSLAESDNPLESTKGKLLNGDDVDDLLPEEKAVLSVSSNVDDVVLETANKAVGKSLFGKVWGTLKGFGTSTDLFDKVCTVKKRLDSVVIAARHYRSLRLLKYASIFVSASDATRTGNVDPKLMNSLMKRVTATDRNGQSIGASPGFAYALKNKFSKDKNKAFKGTYGVDGSLGGVFKGIQEGTDKIPGTSPGQCRVIQNPAFQIGVGALELVGTVLSGGSGAGIKETVKQAAKQSIKSVMSKQMVKSLIKTAIVELSFEGVMALVQFYAEKSLAVDFTGQEKGGELGGILSAGAGVMHKQRGLQGGMVPATPSQYAEAQSEYIAWKKDELSKQSFFARTFDINNPDSIAFNTASTVATMRFTPILVSSNLATVVNGFLSGPFALAGSILNSFSTKAFAQDADLVAFEEYDAGGKKLATDHAGNALPIMRNDIANIDPESNKKSLVASGDIDATTFEPKSDNFKSHVKNCVDEVDILSTIEKDGSENDPKTDCMAKMGITVKYKAHLAYLDMMDTIDASLFPDDVEDGVSDSGAVGGPTGDNNQPIVGNTSSTPCAPGTTDLGEDSEAYNGGQRYTIRLCEIPGFVSESGEDNGLVRVNSTASSNWLNLFNAAKISGINLVASGSYRSMEKQQYFWNCYISKSCNNGNVAAKPGYSNHQIGMAIDLNNLRTSITKCKANPQKYPTYVWLSSNAGSYGISGKVESECWHWSVGGH